jgi:hypothetical protein
MRTPFATLGIIAAGALALAACVSLPEMGGASAALDIPDVEAGDIAEATIKDVTRLLASDAFEGRMPGTPGEEKTIALLTERFKAAGLQPGNRGSWVQDVPLVEITGKDYAPLAITGKNGNLSLTFAKDWVGVTYREDAKTAIANSELVFVGYGINAPEKGWNDYAGVDVNGKTVVILVNDPDWQTEGLEGAFGGKAMTYYGRWTYKFEEAARQGAAAALIVHQTEPAAYGWNVVESSWTGPQAYPQYGDNPPPRTQMNGWVTKDAARKLLKTAGQDLDALTKAAQAKGFKPVPLGLSASTSFASTMRSFTSHNIIGILPGSEAPEEYVLHTAHWDHLGRCTPARDGDDICNGAVDNATGTAALVALAEAHAKAGAPRRTLVFLAVTAEESGLLGAYYYAANPVFPLTQTVPRCRAQGRWPHRDPRSQARSGLLLPLGPLRLRQARRADALYRRRTGPDRGWPRGGRGGRQGLHRQSLSRPQGRIQRGVGLVGRDGRPPALLPPGPDDGDEQKLAELERRRRIPRRAG